MGRTARAHCQLPLRSLNEAIDPNAETNPRQHQKCSCCCCAQRERAAQRFSQRPRWRRRVRHEPRAFPIYIVRIRRERFGRELRHSRWRLRNEPHRLNIRAHFIIHTMTLSIPSYNRLFILNVTLRCCRPFKSLVLAVFVVLLLRVVAVCWIGERTTDGVKTSVMATQRCAHLTWTLTPTLVVTLGNVHTVVLVPSLV